MTANAEGWAGTDNDLLPYGTYEITETTIPVGYQDTGAISQTFEIRENGIIVSLERNRRDIIRGGVAIQKWDNEINEHRAQGGATLSGAVFEIINRSLDAVVVQDVLYAVGEVVYTYETDETGTATTPSNLLPYGSYEVREVTPPAGYLATGVLRQTFVIRENGIIVNLDATDTVIKNDPIRGDLKGVKISDGDAKRMAYVPFAITSVTTGESHTVVTDVNGEFSTASSWNPHSQFTNRGETDRDGVWFGEPGVLDDNMGALLYDTYLMEELPCETNAGYELLTFEVSIYRHNTTVDLGTLTDDRIIVPEIFTTARDKASDTANAYTSTTTTIVDTVYYSGLIAGKEYTVKGVLMDKETNTPLLIKDEQVTGEKTFKAVANTGSVTMEFTFDSTALKGKAVVVFETLFHEDREVAAHADITDEGQTVMFETPVIATSAKAADGTKVVPLDEKATVTDTVTYENLTVGKTYVLRGVLMDKETSKALLIDGKEVTAEKEFTAETATGSVELVFTFNAAAIEGKTLVVFETLFHEGKEVTTHADINDEGQTVTVTTKTPVATPTATPTSPRTGRDGLPTWLLITSACAIVAAIALTIYLREREKAGADGDSE
jgi:hypothetical protein